MGYTHYWKSEGFSSKEWEYIKKDIMSILNNSSIDLELGDGTENSDCISFNGVGKNAYETFYIDKDKNLFNFCKTSKKPYDKAVVASLCYLSNIWPNKITVNSDGAINDWLEGLKLAQTALPQYFIKMPDFQSIDYDW